MGSFVTIAVTVVGVNAALIGWGWQVHISQPHPGAVRTDEYERDQREFFNRMTRIEDKLDDIRASQ